MTSYLHFSISTSLRTTQLIIVPDNQTFVKHFYLSPPAPFPEYLVGPALELSFLTRVLDLQKDIVNLEAQLPPSDRSVRLTDICLKPANQNCAIFSVFQYFQNSYDNLYKNKTDDFGLTIADYITHIDVCKDSFHIFNDTMLNISCYGDFGGVISPSMVLSNYPSTTDGLSARALVITIVMENSNDTEQIASGK